MERRELEGMDRGAYVSFDDAALFLSVTEKREMARDGHFQLGQVLQSQNNMNWMIHGSNSCFARSESR